MWWLFLALTSYLFSAFVSLGDKYILKGPPHPQNYVFLTGVLGALSVFLIPLPFVDFFVPDFLTLFLSLVAGFCFIVALFSFYKGLEIFEASVILPAVGGLTPLFTLIFSRFFNQQGEFLSASDLLSLFLIIAGSVLITFKKKEFLFWRTLKAALLTAFLFALAIFLTKQVYLRTNFWNGFIWMRIFGAFFAAFFVFSPKVRESFSGFSKIFDQQRKTVFIFNQVFGGSAFLLQNLAILLTPLPYLAFVNALQGVQYVFLLILTTIFSFKKPDLFEEEVSLKILTFKFLAVFLIFLGLLILFV
jgi:hypothetical protein